MTTPHERYVEAVSSIMEPYSQSLARVDELEVVLSEVHEGLEVAIRNFILLIDHPNAPEEDLKAWKDSSYGSLGAIQEKIAEAIAEEE